MKLQFPLIPLPPLPRLEQPAQCTPSRSRDVRGKLESEDASEMVAEMDKALCPQASREEEDEEEEFVRTLQVRIQFLVVIIIIILIAADTDRETD